MELLNRMGESIPMVTLKGSDSGKKDWDRAHQYFDNLINSGSQPFYVEPNKALQSYEVPRHIMMKSVDNDYLHSWPKPKEMDGRFVWHLMEEFSQLQQAHRTVVSSVDTPVIKIAIIDTGYHKDHPFLPDGLKAGISFIDGEEGEPAYDIKSGTAFEQEGHGTATACLLAGKKITKENSDGQYEGFFGAIPFAEIIPIRICETVALIRTKTFVDAVKYAVDQGCEVISMSMAGAPSKSWAEVVNFAYENGVVLVTAAGNSWYKGIKRLLPKRVLYPARWHRVIAATGVAADNMPYNMDSRLQLKSEGGETMQGNYGPKDAMESAIAAYTPNIVWATSNNVKRHFRFDGGGTSSATPQVAAAAALWITMHRHSINEILDQYPGEKWRKVEMVKKALFSTSDQSYKEFKTYYGNGILKANEALKVSPDANVEKAEKARTFLWGVGDLLGLLLRLKGEPDENILRKEMFETEVIQEIVENEKLFHLLDYNNDQEWSEVDRVLLRSELLMSERVSERLKQFIAM